MKKYIYPALITLITTPFITDCFENRLQQRRTTGVASAISSINQADGDLLVQVIALRNGARDDYLFGIKFPNTIWGERARHGRCCECCLPNVSLDNASYCILRRRMDAVTPRELQDYFHARESCTQKCTRLDDCWSPICTIIGTPVFSCFLTNKLKPRDQSEPLEDLTILSAPFCWISIQMAAYVISDKACKDNSLNDLPRAPVMVEQPRAPIMAEQPIVDQPENEDLPGALTMEDMWALD